MVLQAITKGGSTIIYDIMYSMDDALEDD